MKSKQQNTDIRFRINDKLKQDFQKACQLAEREPSQVLRSYIEKLVYSYKQQGKLFE